MTEAQRRAEWEKLAPVWIERCARGEINRVALLDRAMFECIGPVTGLTAIDIGCGEGRFTRMLAERGAARVLGIDLCRPLLDAAEKLKKRNQIEQFRQDDMQTLATVADSTYDLAISYVALVDVPDLTAAVGAAWRVIKPGGRYVVCNLAPMATGSTEHIKGAHGRRVALRVERYFDEGARELRFGEHRLTNYHRSLTTYFNTFLQAGFQLQSFREPQPTRAECNQYPDVANETEAPSFVIFDLRKPE